MGFSFSWARGIEKPQRHEGANLTAAALRYDTGCRQEIHSFTCTPTRLSTHGMNHIPAMTATTIDTGICFTAALFGLLGLEDFEKVPNAVATTEIKLK